MRDKIFKLVVIIAFAPIVSFAQNKIAVIDSIEIRSLGTDKDIIEIKGSDFNQADELQIQPIKHQIGTNDDFQWLIVIPNADLSSFLKEQIQNSGGEFSVSNSNLLDKYKIELAATKQNGVLKSTLLIKAKVNSRYYVENARSQTPIEDVAENTTKEILFQRGFVDGNQQVLDSKIQISKEKPRQTELGVPILRLNIIGADGVKNVSASKATQLSIFLNEQKREEISQKFGIQFFVNNISLSREVTLNKSIIYYRYDENNQNLRFLKEALYIAKLIPSESIIKPMINQQQKHGVDIEIYVGKNLR